MYTQCAHRRRCLDETVGGTQRVDLLERELAAAIQGCRETGLSVPEAFDDFVKEIVSPPLAKIIVLTIKIFFAQRCVLGAQLLVEQICVLLRFDKVQYIMPTLRKLVHAAAD